MKSNLIINTKPPHSGQSTKEGQDAALAFAAFGVELGVLFIDDGIFQLRKNQTAQPGQKHTAATFASFPLYDINNVYVCKEDMITRGLCEDDLTINVTLVDRAELKKLLNQYDHLLTF